MIHSLSDVPPRSYSLSYLTPPPPPSLLCVYVDDPLPQRCAPSELLTELSAVLDEDALPFVVKLWRMLIYSTLTAATATATVQSNN